MAVETLSAVAGAFAQTMAPQITRIWNREARLLQEITIKTSGGQGSGIAISWDVEGDGAAAASFAEGADIGPAEPKQDPLNKAQLGWGQYRSAFHLSNLEINAAAANVGNANALEDLVGERFIGSVTKIISTINADCFSGTGTDRAGNPTIVGLDTALAGSGAYANLDPATGGYSGWTATVSGNGGAARGLTLDLLATTEQGVFTASGVEPALLVSSAGVHTKYEGLFTAAQRYVSDGQGPIPAYHGSTGRLFWRGKPLVRDRNNTPGVLYMLDPEDLELHILPWAAASDGVKVIQRAGVSSNGDRSESLSIPVHCYPLARVGSAVRFMVEIYCQLKVKRRNAHARILDISET